MGPKNIAPEHENEMEWERSKKKVEEEMIMKILLWCVCLAYVVAGGRYENFVGVGKRKMRGGVVGRERFWEFLIFQISSSC